MLAGAELSTAVTEQLWFHMLHTLCSHEVGKVPDEFTNHILLPLLVESVMVTPQHYILVLLSEHHWWILGRRRHLNSCTNVSLQAASQSLRTSEIHQSLRMQ